MLTPHCTAASGIVVPPSIVSTTRLRKSAEYGFAIHAGLLPAGSLNHIRAAMGIPDSAFPGNALAQLHTDRRLSDRSYPSRGNANSGGLDVFVTRNRGRRIPAGRDLRARPLTNSTTSVKEDARVEYRPHEAQAR